jgi:hypothetical protein
VIRLEIPAIGRTSSLSAQLTAALASTSQLCPNVAAVSSGVDGMYNVAISYCIYKLEAGWQRQRWQGSMAFGRYRSIRQILTSLLALPVRKVSGGWRRRPKAVILGTRNQTRSRRGAAKGHQSGEGFRSFGKLVVLKREQMTETDRLSAGLDRDHADHAEFSRLKCW